MSLNHPNPQNLLTVEALAALCCSFLNKNSFGTPFGVPESVIVHGFLLQKTAFSGCTFHNFRLATAGCFMDLSWNKCFYKSWTFDSTPVVHYALGLWGSTPQTWHGHRGLIIQMKMLLREPNLGLLAYPTHKRKWFPCPQSFARCSGAWRGHPSPIPISHLGSLL